MNEFSFYLKTSGSTDLSLEGYIQNLKDLIWDKNYSADEASLILPTDSAILGNIKSQLSTESPKYIFLIGIGGSNLGTYAIDMALQNTFNSNCEIFYIDTVSSENFVEITKLLEQGKLEKPNDFLILIITKSGTTLETIANAEKLDEIFSEKGIDTNPRTIIISDEDSKLSNFANNNSIRKFTIPEKVGGRYSVFTAVGLVPLYLKYGDVVQEILDGAIGALWHDDDTKKYIDQVGIVSNAKQNGLDILNHFYFNKEFEGIGKWCRQLFGESLGKEKDLDGKIVHQGIMPITSIGSTDLHSMAQLYLGGPRNIFTEFFIFENENSVSISKNLKYGIDSAEIGNKSTEDIIKSIYSGVIDTYNDLELPFIEIKSRGSKAYSVGYYMQYKMIQVILLAKAMHIDAFDQPSVEKYKINTKKYLQN